MHITGAGWEPGETVTLNLLESPNYDTHPAMTAVADAQGNIANSDFAPDSHDINIRFFLTAAGAKSNAQTTFTDAPKVDVTVNPFATVPSTWVVGTSVTFSVTVKAADLSTVNEGCIIATDIFPDATKVSIGKSAVSNNTTSPISYTFTTSGSRTIQAAYSDKNNNCSSPVGNNYNENSTGFSLPQIVLASSTTGLVTSGSPSAFGQSVTFTATVTSSSGTPSGTVNFYDGATGATCSALASSSLLGAGTATSSPVAPAPFSSSNLSAGTHKILACYQGSTSFGASGGSVTQVVNRATPILTWSTPAAITYGTALSSTQLNATATYQNGGSPAAVAGTFTYTPAAGTILSAGSNQTLSVYFVPTDATDFATPADKTVALNVQTASLSPSITASNKTYDGTTTATFTCSLSGVVGTDDVSCTGGTAVFASAAAGTGVAVTATGFQLTGAKAANYTLASTTATTTANINAKNLTISGVTAADKVYDGTLTATLNAANATLQGVVPVVPTLLPYNRPQEPAASLTRMSASARQSALPGSRSWVPAPAITRSRNPRA